MNNLRFDRPRTGVGRAVGLAATLVVLPVAAQTSPNPSDVATARLLGTEGIMLAEANNCPEAIERLERAEKLFHAPTTLGRLGECQVQLGKIVQGTENLQRVVREPLAPNASNAFKEAKIRADRVLTTALPKIARLRILLKSPPDAKPLITVDGEVIQESVLGVDRPVDPGARLVEVSAPGYLATNARVTLKEGGSETVKLSLEPDPNAARARATPAGPATSPSQAGASAASAGARSSGGGASKIAGYTLIGLGGAGLIAGTVLGFMSNKRASDLDDQCPNKTCPPSAQDDLDSGRRLGTASTIAFAAGGAGVVVGAVLLLTSGGSSGASAGQGAPGHARVGVSPWLGLGSAGLAGRFLPMRHASVFVLAAAAALAVPACTSINGITDFKVDSAQAAPSCTTNQECIDTVGEYNVCRKSDGQCVSLLSPDCGTVFGPYQNDAAVTFGVIGALSGTNASTGISMRNAIELAVADINNLSGLPAVSAATGRRPIVLVECDDKNNNDVGLAVATHLSETLRVPAVFGSNSSSVSLKIFNDVFLKNQTLELAPNATATVFSTFDDQNLFWRTIPSLKVNVDGLVKAMPELEAHVRSQLAPPLNEAPISVGVIIKGDNFGQSSYEATIGNPEFRFNGQPSDSTDNKAHFALADYGNPNASDTTTDFSATIQQMLTLKPNIIFMYGANEIIESVLPQLEAQWPTTGAPYKPFYLFHANGFKVNLWKQIAALDPTGTDLRKRVLGTNPGSIGSDFSQFRVKYLSKYPEDETSSPDSLGTMNSFDAAYVLALATVAAGAEVTGPTLAQGMARLGSGQAIKVGSEMATLTAFNLLSGGGTVDLQGLTGPLDFDAAGEVVSDVYFYCVKQAGSAPDAVGTYPGTKFDPLERKLVASDGTGAYFDELKTYCGF